MDFEWYGSDDECYENSDSGSCLEGLLEYVEAQGCYYQFRYNVCEDMDECIAVIEIDGQYYPGQCEELAEMFGVPYGEDYEEEEETEEETVVEEVWISCMDMYTDVPEVTRCWYLEDDNGCTAVGTMNDQTLIGTCDELIAAAEMGDLTFYPIEDECIVEEQYECMDDPQVAAFADYCYYSCTNDVCNDVAIDCYALLSIDGEDYVGSCGYLHTLFGEYYSMFYNQYLKMVYFRFI